jgi:hypothetical protein
MIFWHTDNEISQTVGRAIENRGKFIAHISQFPAGRDANVPHVFYGILRGTMPAMRYLQYKRADFIYLDNGYFDAEYIDALGFKDMGGKYRICKNDMVEVYPGPRVEGPISEGKAFLLIPPSPYTANFYDTTPEDWLQKWQGILTRQGFAVEVKGKERGQTFKFYFDWVERHKGAVLAFNSMAVMGAMERRIPTYDTHGVLRNADDTQTENFKPMVNVHFDALKAFYEARQFTLEEIAQGKSCI